MRTLHVSVIVAALGARLTRWCHLHGEPLSLARMEAAGNAAGVTRALQDRWHDAGDGSISVNVTQAATVAFARRFAAACQAQQCDTAAFEAAFVTAFCRAYADVAGDGPGSLFSSRSGGTAGPHPLQTPAQALPPTVVAPRTPCVRLALARAGVGSWEWRLAADRVSWIAPVDARGPDPAQAEDLPYANFLGRVHPEDRPALDRANRRAIAQRREYQVVFRFGQGGEEPHWMVARGAVLADAAGMPERVIGVGFEITAWKQAEADRAQAAARLAHDLQTSLAVISGVAQLALRQFTQTGAAEPGQLARQLTTITTTTQQMSRFVAELQARLAAEDRQS